MTPLQRQISYERALHLKIQRMRRELWRSRWQRWRRGEFGLFL